MTIIEMFSISFKQNDSSSNKPPKCDDEIWNIILKGLDENPENRPNLNEINQLKSITKKCRIELKSKEPNQQYSLNGEAFYV